MEITLEFIVFVILALFIGVSAILAVTTKRILRAATYLLFVLFGTAGIYFQLNYSFLGAVQLLVYAGGTMVAVRDPHGFHPLALGRLDGAPVLASETCAFDLLEADYERPIQPGEMLIMDGKGEHSEQLRGPLPERPRQCIFELVYFARPDSFVFGEQVYQCRKQMGW